MILEEKFTKQIIGAGIEVHRHLGHGLLESAYEECLCHELYLRGLKFERQRHIPLEYKDIKLDCGYRMDIVVEAQLFTYLKLSGIKLGLIINFNVPVLKEGIKRLIF